jgi:hypothetical protein
VCCQPLGGRRAIAALFGRRNIHGVGQGVAFPLMLPA